MKSWLHPLILMLMTKTLRKMMICDDEVALWELALTQWLQGHTSNN
jgi:hypothetical protein